MQQEIIEPAPVPAITTKIAEYSQTAAALGELRGKYEKVLFPVATTKGMADAVAARAELRNLRVGLEKMRKDIKAPALERCKDIDAEAKTITAQLTALEDPIDAQIQAETARKAAEKAERERVEAERVAAIRAKIEAIRAIPLGMAGAPSAEIATEKQALTDFDIDNGGFADLKDEAAGAVLSAIRALNDLYHVAKAREDEAVRQAELAEANRVAAAEIERQRVELAAQQAEAARVAAEQQAERDRIAAAELAEQQRVAAETKRQLEAQQAEIAATHKAQAEAQAKLDQAQREFDEKIAAQAAEDARRKAEQAEADRVAALPIERVAEILDAAEVAPVVIDSAVIADKLIERAAEALPGGQYYSTTTFRDDGKPILCNADGTRSVFCDLDDDCPLEFSYSGVDDDVLTIEGVKYAGQVFRQLGGMLPVTSQFELVAREDGVLVVKRLFVAAA